MRFTSVHSVTFFHLPREGVARIDGSGYSFHKK